MPLDSRTLAAIFNREPKAAIEYLQAKKLQPQWNWFEALGGDIHDRVLTVAKVTRLDILQSIQDALTDALKSGMTERDFIAQLEPILRKAGWWGRKVVVDSQGGAEVIQEGSTYRLANIYRTNLQSAFMKRRYDSMLASTDTHPFWQIVGVDDPRTRPAHHALHGRVFRFDDPFIQSIGPPPWGFGCRCRFVPWSESRLGRSGLTPTSGAGKLYTVEAQAGVDKRTGEIIKANRTGMDIQGKDGKTYFFAPDVGFGREWKPDMRDYDKNLARLLPNPKP